VTLAALSYAIETLPAGQRAAFVLRKLQGLPYPEIAAALDCSEEAARARVSEALKKLKVAVA
jgi:RNA polymerase sigma-70 factor (ECF subfamily)